MSKHYEIMYAAGIACDNHRAEVLPPVVLVLILPNIDASRMCQAAGIRLRFSGAFSSFIPSTLMRRGVAVPNSDTVSPEGDSDLSVRLSVRRSLSMPSGCVQIHYSVI